MSDELNQRPNWQILVLAFILWAAHFLIAYGAGLIIPGSGAVGWIALIAAFGGWAALGLCWMRLGHGGGNVVRLAIGISALAISFQTLPALMG